LREIDGVGVGGLGGGWDLSRRCGRGLGDKGGWAGGNDGGGVNVDVDVGGGEGKDLFKVVAILCWEVRGVNIEKILCFVVVVKALEKGAAEAVNLGLSDRPRRVDTGSAAMGNGIEFMGSEFSFAGFGDGEGKVRSRGRESQESQAEEGRWERGRREF
jgi:hypothetical protein